MTPPILLAVPNVSEGRDQKTIAAIGQGFAGVDQPPTPARPTAGSAESAPAVRLLDIHSDPDHHRSVFTVAARQGDLADALLGGARVAVQRIDVMTRAGGDSAQTGQHPHVGALDVAPVVYLDNAARGAACAEALVLADRIGDELEVPVFLYGELSERHDAAATSRADMRRGGVAGLAARMAMGSRPTSSSTLDLPLTPDFGPPHMHPTAGATLVAARAPLVAFNLQLAAPATLADARAVAALIREGGAEGLPGVRAIAVALGSGLAQVSMNIERPLDITLAQVVQAVVRHHRVASAELVGLAPRAALEGFPQDISMPDFDPARHVIENALRC
jgi:glutamate formiminotransferase/glutamate formiminotransferase/formiminotetrahydrofolate cyclodeaminase